MKGLILRNLLHFVHGRMVASVSSTSNDPTCSPKIRVVVARVREHLTK